jgi:hypothetical protein
VILVLCLLVGLALRVGSGRRLNELARVGLRGETVLLVLLVAQSLPSVLGLTGGAARVAYWVWVATFPCLVFIAWLNRKSPGMAILGLGLLLNTVVIVANGGMPVAAVVAAAAKSVPASSVEIAAADFVHVLASSTTRLLWLADVIPLPGPSWIRSAVSAGDCLLFAGIAAFLASAEARVS